MKMSFRWFEDSDKVSLDYIRQVPGVENIITAIYDVPVGEVWPEDKIVELKEKINAHGFCFEVVESVPVHEDIKLGLPTRDKYIENYCETLRNLAKHDVKVVVYNFMPVLDWMRSDLEHILPDGSSALIYNEETVQKLNPLTSDLSLPGWDSSYTKDDLKALLNKYKEITEEDLWNNLKYFLEKVIKVCEEVKIKMAIHPDDPPWSIFGLPRIIVSKTNLQRFLKLVDSEYNGLTICTGSLGVNPTNDMVDIIRTFGAMKRIFFIHARNIKITGEKSFEESAHYSPCGSLDMYEIVKAMYDVGFDGYVRPDHGRMMWGETGRPGYGLYDRAMGAMYLLGLWEAVSKDDAKCK